MRARIAPFPLGPTLTPTLQTRKADYLTSAGMFPPMDPGSVASPLAAVLGTRQPLPLSIRWSIPKARTALLPKEAK